MKEYLCFEWDEEKEKQNIRKHGISFYTASFVFQDDERIEIYDSLHSYDEDRFITIGAVGEILFVVYTNRNGTVRLISARLANERERRIYYGDC